MCNPEIQPDTPRTSRATSQDLLLRRLSSESLDFPMMGERGLSWTDDGRCQLAKYKLSTPPSQPRPWLGIKGMIASQPRGGCKVVPEGSVAFEYFISAIPALLINVPDGCWGIASPYGRNGNRLWPLRHAAVMHGRQLTKHCRSNQ